MKNPKILKQKNLKSAKIIHDEHINEDILKCKHKLYYDHAEMELRCAKCGMQMSCDG